MEVVKALVLDNKVESDKALSQLASLGVVSASTASKKVGALLSMSGSLVFSTHRSLAMSVKCGGQRWRDVSCL